jgi:hypothetical protein
LFFLESFIEKSKNSHKLFLCNHSFSILLQFLTGFHDSTLEIQFLVAENISLLPKSEVRVMKGFWPLFGGIDVSLAGVRTVRGSFVTFLSLSTLFKQIPADSFWILSGLLNVIILLHHPALYLQLPQFIQRR